jgi:hypothetical protein
MCFDRRALFVTSLLQSRAPSDETPIANRDWETVLFDEYNSLRCLRPSSGARRSDLSVLGPRRKRESASTNNNVVVAAWCNRRIKRSVVAVQTIVTSTLRVVDHRQYGAKHLNRLSNAIDAGDNAAIATKRASVDLLIITFSYLEANYCLC